MLPILAFRLPLMVRQARSRPPHGLLDASRVRMRVWPHDLDLYGHVNNGRFLTLMDLGRTDWSVRSGALKVFQGAGWKPVVAAEAIRFRRSLLPLRSYELETRLVGWSGTRWYFQQRFLLPGRDGEGGWNDLAAIAHVRVSVLGPDGPVAVADALQLVGLEGVDSPELPASFAAWGASEAS